MLAFRATCGQTEILLFLLDNTRIGGSKLAVVDGGETLGSVSAARKPLANNQTDIQIVRFSKIDRIISDQLKEFLESENILF